MPRPKTLFTGQWADLTLQQVAERAAMWGFDGLEIACSGEHFDVQRALREDGYVAERRAILDTNGLNCWALSNHLVGQAVCDHPIDARHRNILPERVWGDGEPERVRQRAADEMMRTARAAAKFGVDLVTGFTGSSIWLYLAGFPPVEQATIEAGYRDFADRWNPILDVFEDAGVRFALEVHPSEIAYDYWTTRKTLEAIQYRASFGLNFDPSHLVWQDINPAMFLQDFSSRIYHVHCKDVVRHLDGRNGRLSSHLQFGDLRRGWDFVSVGHGDVDLEHILRTLTQIGYQGPISVEWEDCGMLRERGAPESLARLRELDFASSSMRFDAAFSKKVE